MNKKSRDILETDHRIFELSAVLARLMPQQYYLVSDLVATLRQIETTGSAYFPGYVGWRPGQDEPAE